MRIAILNQPLGNRGDEAAHKALMRSLLKELPGHKFSVIFLNVQPDLIDTFKVQGAEYINVIGSSKGMVKTIIASYALKNSNVALVHPLLHEFKKVLASYDAVICAPGGICMGGFMNWRHIWELDLALTLGKRVYYWGRSIGPFKEDTYLHRLFKNNSLRLLKRFAYVSLRDRVSYKLASKLNIVSNEMVDSAFLETPETKIPEDILKKIRGEYVVFVPNSLTWHYKYKDFPQEKVNEFNLKIMSLIAERFPESHIVMLPQTYKSKINDYAYFCHLRDKFSSPEKLIVIDENRDSDVQQGIIKGAKLVVGERYHSIVFAINNEVPYISLSYEHKMSGLLETLGQEHQMVCIDDIFENTSRKELAIQEIMRMLQKTLKQPSGATAKQIVQKEFKAMCLNLIELNSHIKG